MSNRFSRWAILLAGAVIAAWLTSSRAAGQAPSPQAACPDEPRLFHPCALAKAKSFKPGHTAENKPDLQGLWRGPGTGTENIEEHAAMRPMTALAAVKDGEPLTALRRRRNGRMQRDHRPLVRAIEAPFGATVEHCRRDQHDCRE